MSPNSFELIGIRPEYILGKRALWQERLIGEERNRLITRFNQLACGDVASEIHKLTEDRGLPVWVAHSFRKIRMGHDTTISGCMVPLRSHTYTSVLDNSIISQFVHKIGNHFQLINLLIGSLKRTATNVDEIESLQQTVDRAADFTRSFSQYTQLSACVSAVDLGEMLRDIIKSIGPEFGEKNVAIKNVIERSLDGTIISGDAFLLELAFNSILQNALDATKSGDQIVISGRSEVDEMKGPAIARISIDDTGCGIEKNALTKAVVPFVSSKRDRDGLGLSTAVRIVEIHGGALTISSSPGRGTEVEVLLPIGMEPEHTY